MASQVKEFYDIFSERFIRDYVQGNLRVDRQMQFFKDAIPSDTRRILVIGCGSGESALYLVTQVAPAAKVLAVDLSSNSVQIAQHLFPHPQIEYRQADVIEDQMDGSWDVIVMPDVLEHIPVDGRGTLYARINGWLSERGQLLITCPAPNARRSRRRVQGQLLQIIDEDVTLANLLELTEAADARLSFYRLVSVWHPNDYFHAMIEREPDVEGELSSATATVLKGCPKQSQLARFLKRAIGKLRLDRIARHLRIIRGRRLLK